MNYRHVYHAGNFADVLKHAVLCWIIAYLHQKDAPIRVIETHAGAGRYDLSSEQAARTGEWCEGIARLSDPLAAEAEALLTPYRQALGACGWTGEPGGMIYPGSPLLARAMLRPLDRYIGAELHGETYGELRRALGRDERCKALQIDAWNALRANVPPRERRGVVLIDPPFERVDEWQSCARETVAAWMKWPTGVFAIWYPLKNPRLADDLQEAIIAAGVKSLLRLDLIVDDPATAEKLAGCGLQIMNPPWTLAATAEAAMPVIAQAFARRGKALYRCEARPA